MNKLYFFKDNNQYHAVQNIVSLNFKRILYCKLVMTVWCQFCPITAEYFWCWATPHFFAWGQLTAYILVHVLHSLGQIVSYQRYNNLHRQTRDILVLRYFHNSGRQSYRRNLGLRNSLFPPIFITNCLLIVNR